MNLPPPDPRSDSIRESWEIHHPHTPFGSPGVWRIVWLYYWDSRPLLAHPYYELETALYEAGMRVKWRRGEEPWGTGFWNREAA